MTTVMRPLNELFDLSGRVAIVTGGSRGLGEEMAEGLAEAGASLMLCARREQWLTPTLETFRGRGFTVEGMVCDVSAPEQVQAVVDKTVATYGKVDILVNNAGISWGAEPEEMPFEKWQKVIDTNLTGAFLFSQAAGREMLKKQIRTHHQHRVDRRHPRVRERRALCRIRGEQGRPDGIDARAGGVVGTQQHSRQRHRAGILPFAAGRSGDRPCRAAHQGDQPDPPRRRCGRAQGRRGVPRLRCVELHHRTDHRRRWRTNNA